MDESIHEVLRRNVVTATRNYNHRVKSFVKEVMMDHSNPMSLEYYTSKLEFQGRGAAHNHGTLWLNMEKVEYMIEDEGSGLEYNIRSLEDLFDESETDYKQSVKDGLQKCKNDVNPKTLHEYMNEEKARELIFDFAKDKLNMEENVDCILSRFRFIGLKKAFKKFQSQEDLSYSESLAVVNFADKFTTVCLAPRVVGKKAAEIAKKVNNHKHTKACRKYGTNCRFSFPKYPVWKTLVTNPSIQLSDSQKNKHKKILTDVKDILNDENVIKNIMKKFNKDEESIDEYIRNREKRVKMVLAAAGYKTEEDFDLYIEALSCSSAGYSIILKRDIDEIFVNSYNAEWILAWNGNIDLQICLDFFAVITYITEYFTKMTLAQWKYF